MKNYKDFISEKCVNLFQLKKYINDIYKPHDNLIRVNEELNDINDPMEYYDYELHGDFRIGDVVKYIDNPDLGIATIKYFDNKECYILIEFDKEIRETNCNTMGFADPTRSFWVNKEDLELISQIPEDQYEEWDDINEELNDWEELLLNSAAKKGDLNGVKKALENGANLDIKNDYGETALILASYKGHTEIAKYLVDKGADLDIKNDYGSTALMWASRKGHTDIVKYLVDNGADLDIKNNNGSTALMLASSNGHNEIAKYLVDNEADLNIKNNAGNTALMWASSEGHTEIVKYLVDKGADLDIKDNGGWTALIWASFKGHNEIADYIENRGLPEDQYEDWDNINERVIKTNKFSIGDEVIVVKTENENESEMIGRTGIVVENSPRNNLYVIKLHNDQIFYKICQRKLRHL